KRIVERIGKTCPQAIDKTDFFIEDINTGGVDNPFSCRHAGRILKLYAIAGAQGIGHPVQRLLQPEVSRQVYKLGRVNAEARRLVTITQLDVGKFFRTCERGIVYGSKLKCLAAIRYVLTVGSNPCK